MEATDSTKQNRLASAMMSETHHTYTENGAKASDTSGDALVDLFGVIGALRQRDEEDIVRVFSKAYDASPELAMRILFYARDIRGGLGERRTFRIVMHWLADSHPEAVIRNLRLFGEFGRYDDLYALLDTQLEPFMFGFMRMVLSDDERNAAVGAPVSLLAKWVKTPGVSSKRSSAIGHRTAKGLGMTDKEFKRLVRRLRKHIGIVERKMSTNEWDDIDYSTVPSNAMREYRNAFRRHDEMRFDKFVSDALELGDDGKPLAKVHSDVLYPYDIVGSVLQGDGSKLLEAQWRQLPNYLTGKYENANVIVVADVSGSMMWYGNGTNRPIATSIGLAMYFAERNHGAFGGLWMDFSGDSQFHRVEGSTLRERVMSLQCGHWGNITNLEKAFDRILDLAVDNDVPQEDMPRAIVVVSDMEIDASGYDGWSFYDAMRDRYASHGYEIPTVVFWNVASRHDVFHADSSRKGVMLCSGSSASTFRTVIDSIGMSPYEAMLNAVNVPRYDCVKIAEKQTA